MNQVEICKDMSCVIFNENGYSIMQYIEENTDYPRKKLHGCVLEELEVLKTGELFSNLFIGRPWKTDECDRF